MRVFLSSTHEDLVEHRRLATEALRRLDQQVEQMEVFGAMPIEPRAACFEEIERSELFVGIYAHRYGYIPTGSAKSITEQEFDFAKSKGKPLFCFFINEDHPWPRRMIEGEPGAAKLTGFKNSVQEQVVRETFTTPADLAYKVATSVGRHIAISPIVSGSRQDENQHRATIDALSATVDVANRTLQYVEEQERMGRRNHETEQALAAAWRDAGIALAQLGRFPRELVGVYLLKSQYWSFPDRWNLEQLTAAGIDDVGKIARETQLMLLSLPQTPPPVDDTARTTHN